MILSFRDVTFNYETDLETVSVLRNVDFAVAAGEIVALEGRSGSGKSTILNLAAGVLPVQDGSVSIDDTPLETLEAAGRTELRLRRIGVVFQDGALFAGLNVVDNVALPLELQGVARSEARHQAREVLDRLEIGDLADRVPRLLSGGQRQRVAIARGMVGDRVLLLVDEPTASLDATTSQVVMESLSLAAQHGTSVLVATHDPVVTNHADRTLAIADGEVRELEPSNPAQ